MKLSLFQTKPIRSRIIRLPASGALGLIRSEGAHLSSLMQQYHVTSSITSRFAAIIPSESDQSIVYTRLEKL